MTADPLSCGKWHEVLLSRAHGGEGAPLAPGHYLSPAALWFTLASLACLNSFHYLIHRITILILKVDMN